MHQKYQKCLPTSEISEKSKMHQKCIRNTYFSPVHAPSPDQFLNIFCLLYIHPQLLHRILNSHISPPPTHPKTINILKCKWLPTISLNFFPPDQFLNIFCLLHIHPWLLHLILNSHISAPITHPKTINFVKCKWLQTISLNSPLANS